jgi:hypothetical protein
MSLRLLMLSVTGLLVAPSAHAGVKKIKAELLCGTMSNSDEVTAAITGAGKTGKLTERVVCAMRMADPKQDARMGTIKTIRHTVDAATGKRKDVAGTSFTTDFGAGSEHSDVELTMLSGQPMDDQSIAFQPCEDFDIVATISDDLGVYFNQTIKVVQGCPRPRPFKASVACAYLMGVEPRQTLKGTERPPKGISGATCRVTSGDDRFIAEGIAGELVTDWTTYNDDGSTTPVQRVSAGLVGRTPGTGQPELNLETDADDWPNCQDVDLTVMIKTPDGVLFSKKIHTTITCGE